MGEKTDAELPPAEDELPVEDQPIDGEGGEATEKTPGKSPGLSKPNAPSAPDLPLVNPVLQFIRDVDIRADIFDCGDFGDDKINKTMAELISDLQAKLRLNITNPQDMEGNWRLQSEAYNKLGIAYYRLVRFDCAEICHKRHLQLSQPGESRDVMARNRKLNKGQMKIALVNLGSIFHVKRDNELALKAYELALTTAEELDDRTSQALILGNMSNVHRSAYQFDLAIECEEKRMDILGELCDVNGQIKCYCSLGSLYQLIGEIRNSLLYYNKAVINLKVKILTLQLEELGLLDTNELGEETGEVETRAS